jgi:hypothetical protein
MDAKLSVFKTVLTVPPQGNQFLYLIHFEHKRHHAQHYLGSSIDLIGRLTDHANGQGARLTRALWEDSEAWTLAAVFVPRNPNYDNVRDLERIAKMRHNGKAYCPLCHDNPKLPPGTLDYPCPLLNSQLLRKDFQP